MTTMTDWQPIETAPKDGTEILVLVNKTPMKTRWYTPYLNGKPDPYGKSEWQQQDMRGGFGSYGGPLRPTHWMPLTETPK